MQKNVKPPTSGALERLEEIKAAAVKLFYQRGYEGTDLRLIANELNMHPSSFYNYIASKQQLLYLILLDGMTQVRTGLEEAIEGKTTPTGKLRAAIRHHVLQGARRRYVSWTNHIEIRSLETEYRDEILALRDAYQRVWVGMVEEGVAAGEFETPNPRIAVFAILAMVQGVSRWYNPDGPRSAAEIADEYADVALRGVLARPR